MKGASEVKENNLRLASRERRIAEGLELEASLLATEAQEHRHRAEVLEQLASMVVGVTV